MKTLITYFSFSGHSEQIANKFAELLKAKGEVDLQRLVPKKAIKNFFMQCLAARKKERAELPEDLKVDCSNYDLIVIGSPIWAYTPTPAINAFLDKITDFKGKRVILFLTSGSTSWVDKVFQNIEDTIKAKNPGKILRLNITDKQIKNPDDVTQAVTTILNS